MKKSRADFLKLLFKEKLYYVEGQDVWSSPKKRKFVLGPAIKMQPVYNKGGYPTVKLQRKGQQKTYPIHQVVWVWYVGSYPDKFEINHKDGNKSNNDVANLELCTPKQNTQHAHFTGLVPKKFTDFHIQRAHALLTEGLNFSEAASILGVSRTLIYKWRKKGKLNVRPNT